MEVVYHGSPKSDLEKITPVEGRFGEKVFASGDWQRAVRYTASFEHGGDIVMSFGDGKLWVLNTDPEELIKEKGVVYKLEGTGFMVDEHKGKRDWVLSRTGAIKPLGKIEIPSVLRAWQNNKIYAVSRDLSERFTQATGVEKEKIMAEVIRVQQELVGQILD